MREDATKAKHICKFWKKDTGTTTTAAQPPQQSSSNPTLLKILEALERISLQLTKIEDNTGRTALYCRKYAVTLEKEMDVQPVQKPEQSDNDLEASMSSNR